MKITAARLRELCSYDPETGVFVWKFSRKKAPAGKAIGYAEPRGYLVCWMDYGKYYVHRLVWLYMTGEWPEDEVDHIDRNKSNNRWNNLRQATTKQNMENLDRRVNNTSGEPGVYWSKPHKLWVARIGHNNKKIVVGYFKTFDDAVAARRKAVSEKFTHHSPTFGLPPSYPD